MSATTAGRTEEGRSLFNAGRFFEAHEAWEAAWLLETGPVRLRLQGLIQIAAGYYKAQLGQPAPCARLLDAGLQKLEPALAASPVLAGFAVAVEQGLAQARLWQSGEATGVGDAPVLPPLPEV